MVRCTFVASGDRCTSVAGINGSHCRTTLTREAGIGFFDIDGTAPDNIYGVVLRGRFSQWTTIHDSNKRNWYSIEEYDGKIYLAGNASLACIDKGFIQTVDVGLKTISTHRLHAKDGLLWSIGEKNILVFDGKTWKEILHPDNT